MTVFWLKLSVEQPVCNDIEDISASVLSCSWHWPSQGQVEVVVSCYVSDHQGKAEGKKISSGNMQEPYSFQQIIWASLTPAPFHFSIFGLNGKYAWAFYRWLYFCEMPLLRPPGACFAWRSLTETNMFYRSSSRSCKNLHRMLLDGKCHCFHIHI